MARDTGLGFRISPVSARDSVRPSAPPQATPVSAPAPARRTNMSDFVQTAGRFRDAGAVLAFVGAVASGGLATEARAMRGPGGAWWVEVPASSQEAAGLVQAAGGIAFAGDGSRWVALGFDGRPHRVDIGNDALDSNEMTLYSDAGTERIGGRNWVHVGLEELLAAAPLQPAISPPLTTACVIAPGPLARLVLDRAATFGLTSELAPATWEPLSGTGERSTAVVLQLRWSGERPPRGFLSSLANLPYVAVARPAGIEARSDERLLVDIRYRMPLAASLTAALVPEDERWLLAGPDVGRWRIRMLGDFADGGLFLAAPPTAEIVPYVPSSAKNPLPAPLPVQIGPRPPVPGYPDAVLMDDQELEWMRTLLAGRGVGDAVFIAFGAGIHLVIAPGGLLASMPFGLPLRRIGPGALLMEEGQDFVPRLPDSARAAAFPCGPDELLTMTRGTEGNLRVQRFRLDALVPAWTLWLGEAPPTTTAAPRKQVDELLRIAKQIAPPAAMVQKIAGAFRRGSARESTQSKSDYMRQAVLAEASGDFKRAAELLEAAGEMMAAARLYERAAGG